MGHEPKMNLPFHGKARQVGGKALALLGISLLAANCAGGNNTLAQAVGVAPKQDASLAANPGASGPPQDLPYPTFGAPKQIGDRKVMTPQETQQLETDLQGLAAQREKQMLNELEQSQ